MHQRGALLHALFPVATSKAADRQPAREDPGGQTQLGSHSETRLLHAGQMVHHLFSFQTQCRI